jgi:hypothetical protein
MDPVAERDQVRAAWCKEKQDEVMIGVGAGLRLTRVCTWGLWWFTTKPSGYLVEPQNQDRRLDGWRRYLGAPRSFDAGEHRDRGACVGRTRTTVKVWPPNEE